MIKYFMESWAKIDHDEKEDKVKKTLTLLADEESRNVLKTRIQIYETGNVSLTDGIRTTSEQYFTGECLTLTDQEFFIDLGAYKGDTIEGFIKNVDGNYKKIVAFEPDFENMMALNRYILEKNIDNVIVYKLASWDCKDVLKFHEDGSYISQIHESGASSINTDSLDNVLADYFPVTFIKMDVEGAELKTISGAQNIIKKYKPKLAICAYHRANHIYEIALAINELVPEYKLYLRHHSGTLLDTVLYATA